MAAAKAEGARAVGAIATEDQIGRMGVMYVRSLLAQAALGNAESSPGEDHLSTDMSVDFAAAAIRVQVKAGTKRPNKDGSFSVSTKDKWRKDWAEAKIPVYLVYVHLESAEPVHWLDHPDDSTTIHAHAHWIRVNGLSVATVRVPSANRLTVDTFVLWNREVGEAFGMAVKA